LLFNFLIDAFSALQRNLPLLLVLLKEPVLCCFAGISDQRCSLLFGFRLPLVPGSRWAVPSKFGGSSHLLFVILHCSQNT
jgi:hypothetical protein